MRYAERMHRIRQPLDRWMNRALLGFSVRLPRHDELRCAAHVGTDFPYRQFLPDHAKVAQIIFVVNIIGQRTHFELGLVVTFKTSLRALLPSSRHSHDAHLKASVERTSAMHTPNPRCGHGLFQGLLIGATYVAMNLSLRRSDIRKLSYRQARSS